MGWGNGARFSLSRPREGESDNIDGAIMFYGPVETNVEKIGHFARADLRGVSRRTIPT